MYKQNESLTSAASRKNPIRFDRDIVAVAETNVDDISGEVLSRTLERLIEEGAFDATAVEYIGKKGRVGYTIRAVASPKAIEKFAQILVEETGTLGVKTEEYNRLIVPRRIISFPITIENFKGNVSAKVSEVRGRIRIKPEMSEAKQISDSQKIPLRDVMELISIAARNQLATESKQQN